MGMLLNERKHIAELALRRGLPATTWVADMTDAGVLMSMALLAFHDLDRQLEINQPRLQKGQRQHVLRVDIKGVVAGMGPLVELEERSSPRVALRAEIDALEQVISPSERTAGVSNQPC